MSPSKDFNILKLKDFLRNEQRRPRTRFAPSPTGYLHLGHVSSAIYVWGIARAVDATIILRMEDHDQGRSRKEYEGMILKDLEWLGFEPDDGVSAVTKSSPYRQSDHPERYVDALQFVQQQDTGVYACDCTRRMIQDANDADALELRYDGHCRNRNLSWAGQVGIRMELNESLVRFDDWHKGPQEQQPSEQCGDLLVKDRHGNWTYQWAVTVDDQIENIDLVIRGEDLLSSTGRQILCGEALGRKQKSEFVHHPLIHDTEGRKLSKRDHSTGIHSLREDGWHPQRVLALAAQQVGLLTEEINKISVPQLMDWFAHE